MKKKTFYTGTNYTDDLKARLEKAGVSYGALARAAKIDRSQLSRWFNTDMQPSLANVTKLEKALELILRSKLAS